MAASAIPNGIVEIEYAWRLALSAPNGIVEIEYAGISSVFGPKAF